MGMNFQDQPSGEKPQQKQPAPNFNDPQVDDIFIDSPSSGAKILWIVLAVVVLAGIGGGVYLLNKYGYLNFLHKKPAVAVVTTTPSVAPSTPPPSSPAATTTKAAPGSFAIQVSAFKTKPLADKYVTKLKQKGIDAFVLAGDVPNEGTWFKVCVGSYDTKLRAIAATEDMKKKVGTDVWVVPVQ
jgi:septal ring-binding cell division protein DamX